MPTKKTAPFIVIEALDAGGSQTQTDMLVKRLSEAGYQPLQLHFPQEDRATGRLIYDKFLLHHNQQPFSRREQALLFIQDFFSRSEDLWRSVTATDGKALVVSDRFYGSTMAYQTVGLKPAARQEMVEWITWLCLKGKPALPKPDITLFIDTPPAVSVKHLANKKKDFHENEAKLTAFRKSYVTLARELRWVTLNSMDEAGGRRSREDLHEEIWQKVQPMLAKYALRK